MTRLKLFAAAATLVAVAIAPSLVGRWSPGRHLLEWVDGGVYRSLSAPALDLPTLLRVARSLRSAPR